jgi:hypothetical protein
MTTEHVYAMQTISICVWKLHSTAVNSIRYGVYNGFQTIERLESLMYNLLVKTFQRTDEDEMRSSEDD